MLAPTYAILVGVVLLNSLTPSASEATCHYYLGNLGDGNNIGPVLPANSTADCCAACQATPGCATFTFTLAGDAACYLHPALGRGGVDSTSSYISGVRGDDAQYDDPYNMIDGPGLAGVPLGGIGVGFFDLAPDGGFARVAINNWHQDGVITDTGGTFLAAWRQSTNSAQVLQRRPSAVTSLPTAAHTVFSGVFPTTGLTATAVDDASPPFRVTAWSPFIPHNVSSSSLPVAYIDVELDNSEGTADDVMSVAFSWQDVIGRQMFDASSAQLDQYYSPVSAGKACGFATDALRNAMSNGGIDVPNSFPRVATNVSQLSIGGGGSGSLTGFQVTAPPLQPNKLTLQHYVNRVSVLVQTAPGDQVSYLPVYSPNNATAANEAWAPYVASGGWPTSTIPSPVPGYAPGANAQEVASAVALRAVVPAGTVRTVRFIVTWFADSTHLVPGTDNRTYCGSTQYGKFYNSRFSSLEDVVAYASNNSVALQVGTTEWHTPLIQSSLPPWLSFKIINSAYTMYTNAILTIDGRFSMMEGGMGGLAGTQDQRMVAHILYHKLFPSLDSQELAQFSATQDPVDGSINHFDADLYAGIAGTDGASPLGGQEYNDNTIGWMYQLAKAYQVTGDQGYLQPAIDGRVGRAVDFLTSCKQSTTFTHLMSGSNTYDDFWELPLDSYLCSVYPLALEACRILATGAGNASLAGYCEGERDAAGQQFIDALWTDGSSGGFFAYGANLDGSGRADDIMFGGQVAGSFLGRHAGWGDNLESGLPFNYTQSALAAQLRMQVAASYSFYAPKVWNLTTQSRAIDPRDGHSASSTWPFYLESYTALAAFQAGYVDDALQMLKYIQLVDMRLGLTWSRNLWNPGFITYVAAPVSWFATDVIAGSGLDVTTSTLYLSPYVASNATVGAPVVYPIFFPQAWGSVTTIPGETAGNCTLLFNISKVFSDVNGGAPVVINRVVAEPAGQPSSSPSRVVTLPSPFTFAAAAVLDLSQYCGVLVAPSAQPAILPPTPVG